MRVLVVQEAFVEPKPGSCTTWRAYAEAGVLIHVVVIIMLTKRIVQLLRTWRAAATARYRAERNIVPGQCAVMPCSTAMAPAKEHAREDAKEEDDSRCTKDPFLVRDEG
jgi:hypothetical protein